jgi:tight adherence protein B
VKTGHPDPSALAAIAARLAVLLEAGVPPAAAWYYIGETAGLDAVGIVQTVIVAITEGSTVPVSIGAGAITAGVRGRPETEQAAWRALAAAWAVATEAGAPLATALRRFADTLHDLAQAQREVAIALAAPTLTARLVLALPLVGILFGLLLGFDTLGVLFTTSVGWGCLGCSAALLFGASRWNRRLVRRAQPRDLAPGLPIDLVAIAVSGGASIDRALKSVTVAAESYGLSFASDDETLRAILNLSSRAGVPAAALLRGEASERRRTAFAAAQTDARTLGVRLMVPLGICVLPAFLVVTVVPLLLAVLLQTSLPS